MLIKPFSDIGDDFTPSEDETYIGTVIDNADPDKLGRVKVDIAIYDDLELDQLPWCFPILSTFLGNSQNAVMFSVPEIGSQVRVSFPTRDKYAPFYSGCEINELNKCTFFDEDYPNCYGFKDSTGNFVKVNKSTKKTTIQHSSTTNVEIEENGTTTLTMPEGTVIKIDNLGNISKSDVASEGYKSNGYLSFDNGNNNVTLVDGAFNSSGGGNFEANFNASNFSGPLTADSLSSKNGISGMFALADGRVLYFSGGILVGVSGG